MRPIFLMFILVAFIAATYFESRNVPDYPKPRPLIALAGAYQSRQQLDKAVAISKEVLESPRSEENAPPPEGYYGPYTYRDKAGLILSVIWMNGGLYDKAESLLTTLNPSASVLTDLATIYINTGRSDLALYLLDHNNRTCIRSAACLDDYGSIYLQRHECDHALVFFRQAREMDPIFFEESRKRNPNEPSVPKCL